MSQPKMHTRRDWERENGKRISRGAWERLNRAYEVHIHPKRAQIVGYETFVDDGGTERYVLDKEGLRKPLIGPVMTLTLLRESIKCNRKVSMTDRYDTEKSKRQKYLGEPAGIIKG